MDKDKKLKALRRMASALEDPELHQKKSMRTKRMLAVLAWLGLFVSFLLYFQHLRGIYLPVLASASGVLYGLSLYLDSTIKQWPVLAEHTSLESVRNHISELET